MDHRCVQAREKQTQTGSDKTVDHCVFVPVFNAMLFPCISQWKMKTNGRGQANEKRTEKNEWMEGSRYHLRDNLNARAEQHTAE